MAGEGSKLREATASKQDSEMLDHKRDRLLGADATVACREPQGSWRGRERDLQRVASTQMNLINDQSDRSYPAKPNHA